MMLDFDAKLWYTLSDKQGEALYLVLQDMLNTTFGKVTVHIENGNPVRVTKEVNTKL